MRTGRYTFTHALIRQALLGELSTTRRLWLHQQVGEALEKSPEQSVRHLPQLAHHFSESGPAGRDKAVSYAMRAGARAAGLLAYDEAAAHFRGALALMDETDADDRVRCEAQLALSDALWRSGERGEAKRLSGEAARLARTLDDAELLARAALGYGVGLGGFGYSDQADTALLELLDEALTGLGERDSALRVRVMARLAVELYYTRDRERRVMLSEEALSIARRLDDPAVLLVALYSREKSIEGPDAIDERLAAAGEMLAIATDIGDRPMQFFAHHFRLAALLETGDIDGVDAAIEACDRIATELAQPVLLWQTAVFRAMQAMLAGRFEEGDRYAQEALALGQGAQGAIAAVHFGTQSYQYHWATGRLAEIEEPTRMFAQRYHSSAWRAGLTFLYTELGRHAEARAHFERFASRGFSAIRREGNWVSIIAFLALACADLKDRERAPDLYSMLEPYEDRSVVVGAGANCIGSVSLYLGQLATVMQRWDDAEAHFRRAVTCDEQRRNRPFIVYAKLAWAEMLLERDGAGDRDDAAELLTQARPVAREMCMQSMVQRAGAMQERLAHARRPEGPNKGKVVS